MALVLGITIKQLQGTQIKQSENRPGDIAVSNLAQDSGIALFSIRNINCARLNPLKQPTAKRPRESGIVQQQCPSSA